MTLKPLDERIRDAVTPIVPEVAPDVYTGGEPEYCTWNATELPAALGDGRAHRIRYLVQVHWYLPLARRPYATKQVLRRALMDTPGFTVPTVTDASDLEGQHYVFEFEALGGVY